MASWSWTLLNVLKAVYDLRAEHSRGARTWTRLAWALVLRRHGGRDGGGIPGAGTLAALGDHGPGVGAAE